MPTFSLVLRRRARWNIILARERPGDQPSFWYSVIRFLPNTVLGVAISQALIRVLYCTYLGFDEGLPWAFSVNMVFLGPPRQWLGWLSFVLGIVFVILVGSPVALMAVTLADESMKMLRGERKATLEGDRCGEKF